MSAAPLGLGVVFLNVLLDQLGLPLPAIPTLVLAGALAADGQLPGTRLFALAVAACMLGDGAWYLAGRSFGGRVMKLLCRISLTPDSCVSETQATFERWGPRALVIAKFVPGLSIIAPPLAGATRMPVGRFLALSALGSALWVAAALLGGVLLHAQIVRLLPHLAGVGGALVAILLALLAGYIAFKWRERRRFRAGLDMTRMSVAELRERLGAEVPPLVVDVRSATAQSLERASIPGALRVPAHEVHLHLGKLPREREIVLYCTCPNEASAAQAARWLLSQGFARVWPLRGGLDAWIAAGYAVEELPPADTPAAPAVISDRAA